MACLRKEDLMAFPVRNLRNDELAQMLTDFKNTDPMIMAEAARRLQESFDYMSRGPLGGESISDIIDDLVNPDNKAGRRDIAHRLHVWCLGITSESEPDPEPDAESVWNLPEVQVERRQPIYATFVGIDYPVDVSIPGAVMDAVLDCCYTRIDGHADFDGYVHDECGAVVRQVDREKHYDWCRRVKLRKPE